MTTMNVGELTERIGLVMSGVGNVWNRYVPVINHQGVIYAYISGDIVDIAEYQELLHVLRNPPSDVHTIKVAISTAGGNADTAETLYHALKHSPIHTVGILGGLVASAGTVIALGCKELQVGPMVTFMVHEIALSSIQGKSSDVAEFQAFHKKHLKLVLEEVYGNFLSAREITRVTNGKELWMTGTEVLDRLRQKYLID